MKAKSTIEKQIRRLQRIVADTQGAPEDLRNRCYDAYHALRWVVENTNWTPAGGAEEELKAHKRKEL